MHLFRFMGLEMADNAMSKCTIDYTGGQTGGQTGGHTGGYTGGYAGGQMMVFSVLLLPCYTSDVTCI